MQALISAFKEDPRYCRLLESVDGQKFPIHVWGLDRRVTPLMMEAVRKEGMRLIVTYDEKRARQIVEDCRFYNKEVYYYPAKDALFYYADIHGNTTARDRLEVFRHIIENDAITVVTCIDGLMDKIPALHNIADNVEHLKPGDTIELQRFSKRLAELGYEKNSMVEAPGQFSVRGGILDIFPLTEECPCRVELWGDDIDSIRSFDVESQRSIEQLQEVKIYPCCEMVLDQKRIDRGVKKLKEEHRQQAKWLKGEFRTEQYARLNSMVENVVEELSEFNSTMGLDSMVEYFYDDTVSFLDYFPEDTLIYVDEPEKTGRHAIVYTQEFAASMEGRLLGGYALPTQANVLYDGKQMIARLAAKKLIMLSEIYAKQPAWNENVNIRLDSKSLVSYNNSFEALMSDLLKWSKKQYKILILSPSATRGKRLVANLRENDIHSRFVTRETEKLAPGEIAVGVGRIETGYELSDAGLVVREIFSPQRNIRRKRDCQDTAEIR